MSFAALARQEPPTNPRPGGCTVGAFVRAQSDPAERDGLVAILAPGSGWSHAELARRIRDHGAQIASGTVERHRNGECRCGDDVR